MQLRTIKLMFFITFRVILVYFIDKMVINPEPDSFCFTAFSKRRELLVPNTVFILAITSLKGLQGITWN